MRNGCQLMTEQLQFGKEFNALPDTSFISSLVLVNFKEDIQYEIDNLPGKQASVKILYSIAQNNNNVITHIEASIGLSLFGDYVQQEQHTPNSHPNIRLLLDTIACNLEWTVEVK